MLQSLSNYFKWVHNTQPNNFEYSHKVHFSKVFKENIDDFTDLHIEKKTIWKFLVKGMVSVTGTGVNVYQIS